MQIGIGEKQHGGWSFLVRREPRGGMGGSHVSGRSVILKVLSSGCVGGVGWWGEDRAGKVMQCPGERRWRLGLECSNILQDSFELIASFFKVMH